MITQAYINEVEGGFELHFAERFPYREKPESKWVDFKLTRDEARQIAQEAHSLHILNLIDDLTAELEKNNAPIVAPLIAELKSITERASGNYFPNHRQLCQDVTDVIHYMGAICTDQAQLIARELIDTVKYELSSNLKKWVLQ